MGEPPRPGPAPRRPPRVGRYPPRPQPGLRGSASPRPRVPPCRPPSGPRGRRMLWRLGTGPRSPRKLWRPARQALPPPALGSRLGVPFPGSSPHLVTVVLPRVGSAPGGGSVRAGRWGGLVWGNRRLAVEVWAGDRLPSTWGASLPPPRGAWRGLARVSQVWCGRDVGRAGHSWGGSVRTRVLVGFIRFWARCTCNRAWHTVDTDRRDP